MTPLIASINMLASAVLSEISTTGMVIFAQQGTVIGGRLISTFHITIITIMGVIIAVGAVMAILKKSWMYFASALALAVIAGSVAVKAPEWFGKGGAAIQLGTELGEQAFD